MTNSTTAATQIMGEENSPTPQAFSSHDENAHVADGNLEKKIKRRQVGGAAVAGGLAGLILGGPVVGLVAAGGAAAIATTKGKAGEVARATGNVAVRAGDRLQQIDKKHQVSEKASKGCQRAEKGIKKFDEKHKLKEKTLRSLQRAEKGIKKFDDKHKVTDRTTKGVNKGWDWVANQLALKKNWEDKDNTKVDKNAVMTEGSSITEDKTVVVTGMCDGKHEVTNRTIDGANKMCDKNIQDDKNDPMEEHIQEDVNSAKTSNMIDHRSTMGEIANKDEDNAKLDSSTMKNDHAKSSSVTDDEENLNDNYIMVDNIILKDAPKTVAMCF